MLIAVKLKTIADFCFQESMLEKVVGNSLEAIG